MNERDEKKPPKIEESLVLNPDVEVKNVSRRPVDTRDVLNHVIWAFHPSHGDTDEAEKAWIVEQRVLDPIEQLCAALRQQCARVDRFHNCEFKTSSETCTSVRLKICLPTCRC